MSRNTKTGLVILTVVLTCTVLLAIALVTGETAYLLIESAILHFGIIFAIVVSFERSRRDG